MRAPPPCPRRTFPAALMGLALFVTGSAPMAGEKPRVALITNNTHVFWTYVQRGAEKAAGEGKLDLLYLRPEPPSAEAQIALIEEAAKKGVRGVGLSPNDPMSMQGFLKDKHPRLPLVLLDEDFPDPSRRQVYIGADQYRLGQEAAKLLRKALPKGGKVALFVGFAEPRTSFERRQGLLDGLVGKDQGDDIKEATPPDAINLMVGPYTLLETLTDEGNEKKCQEKAADLLAREPEVACLVGLWEYNAPALMRAAAMHKGKAPLILGFDENFETLQGIRDGKILGTVAQDPYQFGYQTVRALAALIDGKDLKKTFAMDAKGRLLVPPVTVDRGNVKAFHDRLKALRGDEGGKEPGVKDLEGLQGTWDGRDVERAVLQADVRGVSAEAVRGKPLLAPGESNARAADRPGKAEVRRIGRLP